MLAESGATTSFAYDASGNLDTKTGGWDVDWNAENLMTVAKLNGVQQQAYNYDGLGRRVKVDGSSASIWTVSIFSGMDAIYEQDNTGAVTKYVYANGMRIAKLTPSGGRPARCGKIRAESSSRPGHSVYQQSPSNIKRPLAYSVSRCL